MTRKRKLDPTIIRTGDKVQIINPASFLRCGYPMDRNEVAALIEEEHRQEIIDFIKKINPAPANSPHASRLTNRVMKEIAVWLAHDRCDIQGFGGRERQIFRSEPEIYLKDRICVVNRVKYVKTGTYYPPTNDYDAYTGERDWEPGGLEGVKTHKIIEVFSNFVVPTWIEAANVEKIIPEERRENE